MEDFVEHLSRFDVLADERVVGHGELGRVVVDVQHLDEDGHSSCLTRVVWRGKKRGMDLKKIKKSFYLLLGSSCFEEGEITYFSGHHRDVVPLGHLPVQGFQGGNGAVHDIDVKQPLEIRVAIDGVPGRTKEELK